MSNGDNAHYIYIYIYIYMCVCVCACVCSVALTQGAATTVWACLNPYVDSEPAVTAASRRTDGFPSTAHIWWTVLPQFLLFPRPSTSRSSWGRPCGGRRSSSWTRRWMPGVAAASRIIGVMPCGLRVERMSSFSYLFLKIIFSIILSYIILRIEE